MAARAISASEEQWERVAQRVYERRDDIGLTATDVVKRAGRGLSLGVLSQIENNRKTSYSVRTISALERALAWLPRSVQGILDGGEPEEAWEPPADDPIITMDAANAEVANPLAETVADLRRRLDAVERELARQRSEPEAAPVSHLPSPPPDPWHDLKPDLDDPAERQFWTEAPSTWTEDDQRKAIWLLRRDREEARRARGTAS